MATFVRYLLVEVGVRSQVAEHAFFKRPLRLESTEVDLEARSAVHLVEQTKVALLIAGGVGDWMPRKELVGLEPIAGGVENRDGLPLHR